MPQNNPLEQSGSKSTLKNLPKPQKIAVVFLLILAILVIVFWVLQMRSNIRQPFDLSKYSTDNSAATDSNQVLQASDTDQDGLSDYDEIYVNKTSPYLEDSDSDGLTDKQEVDQGSDPNCPQGKDCNAAENLPSVSSTSTLDSLLIPPTDLGLSASSSDAAALQQALAGSIDATTLRQLLIASGVSAETLNQISDEDLMKSYQETLASQAAATSTNTQ
jgi:hypothetical protein